VAPPEPAYIAPPAVEDEPEPIEPAHARADDTPLTIEPEPQPIAPEPPRFETDPPRFEPEPSRREPWFEHESAAERTRAAALRERAAPVRGERPPRLEPESSWFEPEPVVDLVPSEDEPEPKPIEPAPPIIEPEPQPILRIPPYFEPVRSAAGAAEPPQPVQPPEPPRRRRSKISPHARPHRVLRPGPQERSGVEPPSSRVAPPAPVEPSTRIPLPPADAGPRGETTLGRDTPLVERCFVLYQEKRFGEVLSPASRRWPRCSGSPRPVLHARPRRSGRWSGSRSKRSATTTGRMRRSKSSIDSAAEPERSTYRRHLATLALEAAQARLARAGSHDAGDRIALTRPAIAWTERGLAVVPADTALTDARAASHEALWQAYEQPRRPCCSGRSSRAHDRSSTRRWTIPRCRRRAPPGFAA
jgi:hypothetical protein